MCCQPRHNEDKPFNQASQGTLGVAQRQGNVGAAAGLDEATLQRRRGMGRRRLQMPRRGGVQPGGSNSCSTRRRRTSGDGPTDAQGDSRVESWVESGAPHVVRVRGAGAGARNAAIFWKCDDRAALWIIGDVVQISRAKNARS
jgi:hypothetical protein